MPERDDDERNERVLHTRVPESLDRQLKRRARGLGMSVSTVVRHVLLNTFGLVEDIVTDGANVALSIAGEAPLSNGSKPAAGASEPETAEVIGWQEMVLNRNAVCERCNAVLRTGIRAALGVRERPGPATIICRRCLAAIARPEAPRPRQGES